MGQEIAAMKAVMVLLSLAVLASHVRAASIIFPEDLPMKSTQPAEPEPEPPTEPPPRRIAPRQPMFDLKVTPKCAKNSRGICSGADGHADYPTELIRRALRDSTSNAVISEIALGDDVIANDTLGNRFGGSVHDDNTLVAETAACAATEEIVYPSRAQNTKGEWLYVANIDNVQQGVRVETCLEEGRPCRIGEGGTTCRQKYIYRKLLAMDRNMNLDADNFRIPSSCVCYIKNDYLTLVTRLNAAKRNPSKASGRPKRMSRFSRRRSRRQAEPELNFIGGEAEGLPGSPLDNSLPGGAAAQGTAQQSIETEETLSASDTIGKEAPPRFAGEIVVESNPIFVEKKAPKRRPRGN